MASEGSDFKTDVTVYDTGSTLDTHRSALAAVKTRKPFINILSKDLVLTPGTDEAPSLIIRTAAQQVAEGINKKV